MRIRVCSTIIHPREVNTPSNSSPGVTYTTITPTILNDAFCDCPGYQWNGGVCSHTKIVDEGQCNWMEPDAVAWQFLADCPECGAPLEDFETDSEIL